MFVPGKPRNKLESNTYTTSLGGGKKSGQNSRIKWLIAAVVSED